MGAWKNNGYRNKTNLLLWGRSGCISYIIQYAYDNNIPNNGIKIIIDSLYMGSVLQNSDIINMLKTIRKKVYIWSKSILYYYQKYTAD